MLFLGSFRHGLPGAPEARLLVVGSEPPPRYTYAGLPACIQVLDFVEDIRAVLAKYAVFVCPEKAVEVARRACGGGVELEHGGADAEAGAELSRADSREAGRNRGSGRSGPSGTVAQSAAPPLLS